MGRQCPKHMTSAPEGSRAIAGRGDPDSDVRWSGLVVYRRLTVQSARPTGDDPRYFRAARPRPDDLTAMRQMSRNIPTVSRR